MRSHDEQKKSLHAEYDEVIAHAKKNNHPVGTRVAAYHLKMNYERFCKMRKGPNPPPALNKGTGAPKSGEHQTYLIADLDRWRKSDGQVKSGADDERITQLEEQNAQLNNRVDHLEELLRRLMSGNTMNFTQFAQFDVPLDFATNDDGELIGQVNFLPERMMVEAYLGERIVSLTTHEALHQHWTGMTYYMPLYHAARAFLAQSLQDIDDRMEGTAARIRILEAL